MANESINNIKETDTTPKAYKLNFKRNETIWASSRYFQACWNIYVYESSATPWHQMKQREEEIQTKDNNEHAYVQKRSLARA